MSVSFKKFNDEEINFLFESIFSKKKKEFNIILAAGKSTQKVIQYLKSYNLKNNKNLKIFLSDERCVNLDSENSNSFQFRKYFKKTSENISLNLPNNNNKSDWYKVAKDYEESYPEKVDAVILSLAEDGHIASIWPNYCVKETSSFHVVPSKYTKGPFKRMSITLKAINLCNTKVLLVLGRKKNLLLKSILRKKKHPINKIKDLVIFSDKTF